MSKDTITMERHDFKNDREYLGYFILQQKIAGGILPQISEEIEKMWNEYKLDTVKPGTTIITADFGKLGTVEIREVVETDEEYKLKYKSGSYDYISIRCKPSVILWTDYLPIEPYNRNSGLYGGGARFEYLGDPVATFPDYREFKVNYYEKYKHLSNVSFGVWGYRFNNYYGSITFGICLESSKTEEFISKLRTLINK